MRIEPTIRIFYSVGFYGNRFFVPGNYTNLFYNKKTKKKCAEHRHQVSTSRRTHQKRILKMDNNRIFLKYIDESTALVEGQMKIKEIMNKCYTTW